jgi:hypothetical protein
MPETSMEVEHSRWSIPDHSVRIEYALRILTEIELEAHELKTLAADTAHKAASDAAYERCTTFLLGHAELITTAFATHNVRSCAHAIARADMRLSSLAQGGRLYRARSSPAEPRA